MYLYLPSCLSTTGASAGTEPDFERWVPWVMWAVPALSGLVCTAVNTSYRVRAASRLTLT